MSGDIELPSFIDFPDALPIYVIDFEEDKNFFIVDVPDQTFLDIQDTVNYIKDVLNGTFEITKSVKKQAVQENLIGQLSFKIHNSSELYYVNVFTLKDEIKSLKREYGYFLQQDELYQANRYDWTAAYNWLEKHPAFYYRKKFRAGGWELSNGLQGLWISVGQNDYTKEVILEHGPYGDGIDEKGRTLGKLTSSHDYRLDVYEKTFEDAYVALAYRVNFYYDVKGEEIMRSPEEIEKFEFLFDNKRFNSVV